MVKNQLSGKKLFERLYQYLYTAHAIAKSYFNLESMWI